MSDTTQKNPAGLPREAVRSERELVQAALGGDSRARGELTERLLLVPRLLSVRNRRGGSPFGEHELADLVQDALMVIWRKLPGFEGRAALETWVYRVCVLEWMNALRRRSRGVEIEHAAEAVAQAPTGPTEVEAESVREALRALGPPDGDVIRMKHYADMTFADIGGALEVSPSTVKSWYYRGLDRLRVLLADHGRGVS